MVIEHKTVLKNPRRHLRQNRPISYFVNNDKIDTTFTLLLRQALVELRTGKSAKG